MYIGLDLNTALKLIKDKSVEIVNNNSNKLTDYDAQLVVGYKEIGNRVILTVSNFKLEV